MSNIEVIEEYRALWAQAQQELQMTQVLVAAIMLETEVFDLTITNDAMQAAVDSYTLDLEPAEGSIAITLKENADA